MWYMHFKVSSLYHVCKRRQINLSKFGASSQIYSVVVTIVGGQALSWTTHRHSNTVGTREIETTSFLEYAG